MISRVLGRMDTLQGGRCLRSVLDNNVVVLRENQAMLITQAIWKTEYKLERQFATCSYAMNRAMPRSV
jgi:hypothetical protein